jgi:hypothetical protein
MALLCGFAGRLTAKNGAFLARAADASDTSWLCFDIDRRAAVYVLYDKRATDRPGWLKSVFKNMNIATVDDNTDVGKGNLEIYSHVFEPGTVRLAMDGAATCAPPCVLPY